MAVNAQKVATMDKNLRTELQAIKQIQQGMASRQPVMRCSCRSVCVHISYSYAYGPCMQSLVPVPRRHPEQSERAVQADPAKE